MDCRGLIEKFVNDRDKTIVDQIKQFLLTNQLNLIDFIVCIGEYLQSTEVSKRSTALMLVADILDNLPNTFLKDHEIHHLLIFVCAKLNDHYILGQPAIDLFRTLSKQAALADEDCLIMIKSIFSDVYVQSFPQASRYSIYVILLHFLLYRLEVIQQLGSDFVCNFIQSMDSERDPRNLVLCFQCLQYMTKYLDIEPYKEELFEVVACYFPMEYKPKGTNMDNEETITSEQLTFSLRNVLISTGKFAQYCIPMLIEKLESDIPSARLAAMDVFIHCIDEYDARDIAQYLKQLWNLFSKQALCSETQEIEIQALKSITALMQLIGKSIQNDETEISTKKFVDQAIRGCESFLKELDLKLAWPAAKVLQAVARANSTCASLIWSKILPLLIKQFENLEQVNHKKLVLDMIAYFLQPTGIRSIVKLPYDTSEELWILISTHFENYPSYCLSLIDHLLQLNCTPGQALEDNLTKFILANKINDELKHKLSTVLRMLASSVTFDRISTNLLTNLINSWTITKIIPSNQILECCIDLCHNTERCHERLERFFTPIEQLIPYIPSLFKYLPPLYVLENLFLPLFDLLVTSIIDNEYAKIFSSRCGSIADESCKNFVENFCENNLYNDAIWQKDKEKNLILTIYFISNLKRKYFQNDIESIYNKINMKLVENIFNQSSNEIRDIYAYFYGNLVNKLSLKNEIVANCQTILTQCETIPDEVHIHLWTIIVKSLVSSRPVRIEQYLSKLMLWMNEKSHTNDLACQSLKVLTNFNENSLLLSSDTDCFIHPMVKQILFAHILSHIKPFLNSNDLSTNQMNILIDLLNNIPKSIIQDDLLSLLPILIRALTSSNESIWLSSLNSISDLIQSEPNSVIDHIDTLIPRLAILTTYKNDMFVRITSLKCLKYLTKIPIHKIQPYRCHVLNVLKASLDDHKRLVRKEAVETRMSWCLLNV